MGEDDSRKSEKEGGEGKNLKDLGLFTEGSDLSWGFSTIQLEGTGECLK